ncbi:hypothetical protein RJ640_003980 [Escallonia rubra]|uniref:F-box protein n=1 Tax=Escallonia rubra TaxID=112253 RepID=A0AA88UUE7_9ASTE|nr:hypothetical protein RJ640_003980 [Escallonia rubra]
MQRYEVDLWTHIAKFLDGKSLVMLAATNRWFKRIFLEESIWKFACLRDLEVPDPKNVGFKWINLYASAFGGSHSFMFRQIEKHIGDFSFLSIFTCRVKLNSERWSVFYLGGKSDWMRVGAFFFDSPFALLTEKLMCPLKLPQEENTDNMLESCGSCVVKNVRTGIWIADLQLVRCPVCDLETCDGEQEICFSFHELRDKKFPLTNLGTMQMLDARHIELFLNDGYQDGSWEYEMIGSHDIRKHQDGASGAIFDLKHLNDKSSSDVFNLKSWAGKPKDWQPRVMVTPHAVAINTNLQENEGLNLKFQAMTAGAGGEVVSIRISQQLL